MKTKQNLLAAAVRVVFASAAFLSGNAALGAISVYLSPPDVQSAENSGFSGVTIRTENFNSLPASSTLGSFPGAGGYMSASIGANYTAGGGLTSGSGSRVTANNQFCGSGEGNYLGVSVMSSVTITLGSAEYVNGAQYFGFHFSAGNPFNQIDLYDGGTLIFSFTTASLIDLIPANSTVTAIGGGVYNTNDYYGQPGSGLNPGEPYAYVHFIATEGMSFDRIVLQQNSGPFNPFFESDNHSIMEIAPAAIPGTFVGVPVVPEPSAAVCGRLRRSWDVTDRPPPREG